MLIDRRDLGLFWALYSVPLVHVSVLMSVPGCFDYSGLVIHFDIRYCDPSYFALLSQNCCTYSGSFINFLSVCSISVKYAIGTLIGIALNL